MKRGCTDIANVGNCDISTRLRVFVFKIAVAATWLWMVHENLKCQLKSVLRILLFSKLKFAAAPPSVGVSKYFWRGTRKFWHVASGPVRVGQLRAQTSLWIMACGLTFSFGFSSASGSTDGDSDSDLGSAFSLSSILTYSTRGIAPETKPRHLSLFLPFF